MQVASPSQQYEATMTSPLEQKKIKVTGPVVITANRTRDGAVIYRYAEGWTTHLGDAAIVTDATGVQKLMAAAAADDLGAIGAYVAPVQVLTGGQVRPGNLRETIRVGGPTIKLPVAAAKVLESDAA
jgi:Protein of unknown function (DUF2849)